MSNVPTWWQALLLGLAAYRVWRLLAEDSILDRPRRWVLRLGDEWQTEGDPVPPEYRFTLGRFVDCPWCLGFWLSIGWWVAWLTVGDVVVAAATPLALSAFVGFVSRIPGD